MNTQFPRKHNFIGWVKFLEQYRKDLVWESLGLQNWNFSTVHREALQGLFLAYLSSRLNHENFFDNPQMAKSLGMYAGRAMEAGFDPDLDDKKKAEFFKQLSLIIGFFGVHGSRPKRFPRTPKVRQIECTKILMEFLAREEWPSNKQLVEKSKQYRLKFSEKDFSEMADGAGLRQHLSSSR